MCTAIRLAGKSLYFGRNLDLEFGYGEQIAVTPRNYPIHFRNGNQLLHHYAMIGMATMANGYPLYYEATNEMGLSIAALNFPQLAHYQSKVAGKENLAPYELILYILGQCKDLQEAMALLPKIHLWALPFSRQYPLTPLHWLLADETGCMVLEPTKDGLKQYPNPAHVLTNAPGFPWHQYNLANYMQLHNTPAENNLGIQSLRPYSNGMGAMGLPGDLSSASRFVRASFHVAHATKDAGICDFFHILHSVAMPRGSVYVPGNLPEITRYSCCCDVKQGIYYYTTYTNSRIRAVRMANCRIDGTAVETFDLMNRQDIFYQN